jgi:hypothetical protein
MSALENAYNNVYLSERGMPLLYVGQTLDKPVITLENYTKWYRIYLVTPSGEVQSVLISEIEAANDKLKTQGWVDHLFHPQLLIQLARDLVAYTDERALECAGGRWLREHSGYEAVIAEYPSLEFRGEHDD